MIACTETMMCYHKSRNGRTKVYVAAAVGKKALTSVVALIIVELYLAEGIS